jgi:phage-related baseplate assembly protein
VKTFGRAVSLADFEAIVTTSGVTARAYVTWVWSELERAVHVTVAGPNGTRLSADTLTLLRRGLDASRDPNRPLFLANLVRVPIVISARLLRDPAYKADAVVDDARARLLAFFDFNAMPLGEAIFSSEIYATLQSATGVLAVDVDVLQLKGYQDLTPIERAVRAVDAGPLQAHIRIFPARPTPPLAQIDRYARTGFDGPPPPVLAAEQAYLEELAADLVLTAVEGF